MQAEIDLLQKTDREQREAIGRQEIDLEKSRQQLRYLNGVIEEQKEKLIRGELQSREKSRQASREKVKESEGGRKTQRWRGIIEFEIH
jgi:hypothetical protein